MHEHQVFNVPCNQDLTAFLDAQSREGWEFAGFAVATMHVKPAIALPNQGPQQVSVWVVVMRRQLGPCACELPGPLTTEDRA